jgi:tetratricopeptide (TPR) repeat protein
MRAFRPGRRSSRARRRRRSRSSWLGALLLAGLGAAAAGAEAVRSTASLDPEVDRASVAPDVTLHATPTVEAQPATTAAPAPSAAAAAQVAQAADPPAEVETAPGETDARYRAAFEAMMADPSDAERAFEFAQAAVVAGDVRGAIAALERILLINPNLPNIALELGVLYRQVGNDALAAQYLRQALAAEQIPPLVRERAEAILGAAEAAITRHQFRGSVFAGVRYETNANATPDLVRVGATLPDGTPIGEIPPDEPARSDFSAFIAADLGYDYLLGTQAGDAIETNLSLFAAGYGRSPELQTELIGLDVGPRLQLGPVDNPLATIRPFAEASYLRFGAETYRVRYGGGLGVNKSISPRLFADGELAVVYQDFRDTEDQPRGDDRSGLQIEVGAGLAHLLRPTTTVSGRLDYVRRNAEEDHEAFHDVGLLLAATENYRGPFELAPELPWSATLTFGVRYANYDGPDPQIDPGETREDWQFAVALTNTVPITRSISFSTSARYLKNQSNLPNFDYDNFSLTAGIGWRF